MSFERKSIDDDEASQPGMSLIEISARRQFGGRPRLIESPEQLLEHVLSYFRWLENNPHHSAQVSSYQGDAHIVDVPRKRVATIRGLCLHIGCSYDVWLDWRGARPGSKNQRPDLQPVMHWAETAIYEDKYNGAASGLLNANLIMRDLGLAERSEVSGPNGGPQETVIQYQLPSNGRD